MKLTCLTRYLKEAVLIADRNTSKNQTLPILSSLYISAKDNKLTIRATNLETALELNVPCKVEAPGMIVISGKTLSGFLSNISDEQISIQNNNNNLFVKTRSGQTTLRGFSPDDFPLFPTIDPLFSCVLLSEELHQSIDSVAVATSVSDIKPELSSVFFRIFKNTLKLAATDSFRLAEKSIVSKKMNAERSITFLVPNHSIQELLRLFDNSKSDQTLSFYNDKEVEIILNKNQIVFQNKAIRFISRLTDGVFPEYEQIIPKTSKTEVICKRSDLIHHVKLASVFASRLNDVKLSLNVKDKDIEFSASNPDIGEHQSNLDVSIQGDDVSAKFNWRYVIDGAMRVPGEYIMIYFNGEQSPLLLKGKGDSSYTYLVMPMRGI